MDIDEERAQELRNNLLLYRFHMLKEHRELFKGIEATEMAGWTNVHPTDTRYPWKHETKLLAIAREMYEEQKEEEYTSPEAEMVLRAFIEIHKEKGENKISLPRRRPGFESRRPHQWCCVVMTKNLFC